MLKLKGVEHALANFFAQGLFELREKLGPILWQLPPRTTYDPERLDAFFALLPRDTATAVRLARRRDARMKGRCRLSLHRGDPVRPIRHALEIRHESFLVPAFVEQLRRNDIALVVSDAAGLYPERHDLCSDFTYIRLHGAEQLYTSGYDDAALAGWADRIRNWTAGTQPSDAKLIVPGRRAAPASPRDVYCYFDNDAKVHAPRDAARLARQLDPHSRLATQDFAS